MAGKSKEIQAAKAAAKNSTGKAKKKAWTKRTTKEKANNEVFIDEKTYKKLVNDIPKAKNITISSLVDRLGISGSVARRALEHLESEGHIKCVVHHASQKIYTRATAA
eukprot:gb/GECH01011172.1/.p1 GENE.gb/GECH01011172.1/~~gb/GECH01011172.1/.p1  ORF type:complete len:108 (+),score=27.80 gb/GECH01011172.1/:1-324(+)